VHGGGDAMKELLLDAIKLAPAYFGDLLQLMTTPRGFLAERALAGDSSLVRPLLFLAMSFLLSFTITLPWASGDPLLELATDAVFVFASITGYGYALFLSWRALGATAPVQRFFVLHCYVAGVLKLLQSATFLLAVGVLRVGNPAGYDTMMAATRSGDALWFTRHAEELLQLTSWRLFTAVGLLGYGVMLGWVILNWSAYRTLTGLSRGRSAMAFGLFCLGCVPVYVITATVAAALVK
jgi:hypothetical protein